MNMDYSLDMLRMRVRVSSQFIEQYANAHLMANPYVSYYESRRATDYRYHWSIKETYASSIPFDDQQGINNFHLMYQHNTDNGGRFFHDLIIEYNPNKCNIREGLLHGLLHRFFCNLERVDVMTFDVCCDLYGIGIDDVYYDSNRKGRQVDYRESGGRTIYVGARSANGSVKVYDKAAEQKVDGKWVRWETTIKPRTKESVAYYLSDEHVTIEGGLEKKISVNLPSVYIRDEAKDDTNDIMMKCAIYAIEAGRFKLSDFNKYHRKQIKPLLKDAAKIEIGNNELPNILNAAATYFKQYINVMELEKYMVETDIIRDVLKAKRELYHQVPIDEFLKDS